jgi:hypothetical protein
MILPPCLDQWLQQPQFLSKQLLHLHLHVNHPAFLCLLQRVRAIRNVSLRTKLVWLISVRSEQQKLREYLLLTHLLTT